MDLFILVRIQASQHFEGMSSAQYHNSLINASYFVIVLLVKRKLIILVLIFILLALLYSLYSLFLKQPKVGFIKGQSDTIVKLSEPGKGTSLIMDFSNCSKGSDVVYFGLGSTHFAFEGIKQGNCVFYYGTEIEDPGWDRTLAYKCTVPTLLGKRAYSVGYMGISMKELDVYCRKL